MAIWKQLSISPGCHQTLQHRSSLIGFNQLEGQKKSSTDKHTYVPGLLMRSKGGREGGREGGVFWCWFSQAKEDLTTVVHYGSPEGHSDTGPELIHELRIQVTPVLYTGYFDVVKKI